MIPVALGLAATISVLAFGGVTFLWFLPAELIVCAAALVAFWKAERRPISRATAAVIALLIAIPVLQLVPLPQGLLGIFSPGRSKLIREFAAVGVSLHLPPTVSLGAYDTALALLRLVCYVLVFLLAVKSYRSGSGSRNLPRFLIGIGLAESLYGLVQYLAGWQYIYIYRKTSSLTMASGTYVNYNHFAGLLEMVLPFLIVALWLEPARGASPHPFRWSRFLAGPEVGIWLWHLALLAVVFLALIFSQSRSGIVAGMTGMVVAGSLGFRSRRGALALLPVLAVVILLLSYSVWIGLSPVLGRFENAASRVEMEQGRPLIWKDTLSLIRDFPLLGSGLGTYPSVSLHYQTAPGVVRYEHAHNDYLEFAADMGVPAALLLFGGLWTLALKAARRSLTLERRSEKRLAAACAGAMIALLTHALTDFNLQIPANALLFSWITGTAAAVVSLPHTPPAKRY